ncbi:type I restriction-modification system subunit M [Shewanella xiamenensis]|uniref:site-specific DNA-methyltransferase (adenine-specific) n=1 Tax=Shewanella xiamenensis TaxID=332186 RepID=A0AAE4THB6_9GAMM|nr:type I restriction-modification system subunit M [Shewanella xiamenensis]MDV5392111.1 type I restriction-modification system subunit M [Shewanella xiamenensis]
MAIKKTELYSSLWASCDELRGGMDASQYKDYVLTMLFMKYVSDKAKNDPTAMIDVPVGADFKDMVALKGKPDIGEGINKIIAKLAEENDLKSVIDIADFNDEDKLGKGKEMVDRLTKLVGIFEGLDLSGNRADGDDLLGDAYEYLMRHFATESGKSKGQFYTPSEVSRILAKVIGIDKHTSQDASVYDPTCGSGSLLLKANDEAPRGLSIFGQEMDNATSALARMNMILHDNVTAKIAKGNTLAAPEWKDTNGELKTFDFAVANPPFSNKNWTSGINAEHDEFKRFGWGVPPEKNGDYAFLLHIIKSLKSTGKGAVILPHGVLFRGNAEARIRENLLKQGYIKGIIGLPANLFYGTGIPACIIVIDKESAASRMLKDPLDLGKTEGGIFMVDASKGFAKDGNKNRLRAQDIHKIVDVFTKQLELKGFSRLVSLQEIAGNDYNLNIPRYIDSSEGEDLHDLSAHLAGGIPERDVAALDNYWQVLPSLRATLFAPQRAGYLNAKVVARDVKSTILQHPEFTAFASMAVAPFEQWFSASALDSIDGSELPKALINRISEALLTAYDNIALLSKYDVYQLLMDYWQDTMQDDVYVLVQDGWDAGKVLRELMVAKGEKLKEVPDLVIGKAKYKAELLPPALLVKRFFAAEQAELDRLQSELDSISQELESYIEEHSAEDGFLADALNDKDKVTAASVKARLKLASDPDERKALQQVQRLFDSEGSSKKAVKEQQDRLDRLVFKRYATLTTNEVKTLLVQDKWQATLQACIQAEIERMGQQLASRVKDLEERYAEPLPQISKSVDVLSAKVAEHLKAMGLEWAV